MCVSRWMFGLVLAFSPAARATARVAADPLPGRRIDRLVAGPDRLFALRGGEVVTFDGFGQAIGRCGGFVAPPRHEGRAPLGAPDAEEVLRAAGLPDDDSTPDAEDALEDEGLGPRPRRLPAPPAGIEPRALASTGAADLVWIATSSGIFRGDETGCTTAGLGGRDLVAVAAARGVVIAASEDLLFRRESWSDGQDTGAGEEPKFGKDTELGEDEVPDPVDATFAVAGGLASRPRALAVGPDGEAIVADDEGVLVVGPDGASTRILDRPTDAVAVCGDIATTLSSDGVYRWRPGASPARVGDRPPARALACGPGPAARWIATGLGVWTSADGTTWTERTEMLGRSVAGAAVLGDRLWLAGDDGLVALDTLATPEDGPARAASGWPALPTRRLIGPTAPWPWVTAAFGTERTPDRHAWSIMVLLTFPLGRMAGRHVDPTSLAGERARRDSALAAEQTDLEAAPSTDEVDARLAALRQEREALR